MSLFLFVNYGHVAPIYRTCYIYISCRLHLYIGRVVSIYPMVPIYSVFSVFSLKADKQGILIMDEKTETRNLTIFLNK